MAGSRFNAISRENWQWLGPAFKGLSDDVDALEAGGGSGTISLSRVTPGAVLRCPWNGTEWTYAGSALSVRPSARTDIYFELTGAPVATASPA